MAATYTTAVVYRTLDDEFASLDSFFQIQFDSLRSAETELWALFGLRTEPADVPGAVEMHPRQLAFLLRAYSGFQRDLDKLYWFQCANTEALDRILAKLGRYGQAGAPEHQEFQTKWYQVKRT